MGLLFGAYLALSMLVLFLWWYLHIPSDMPKTTATIPIYVFLLGLWSNIGQDEIYNRLLREPLERYGAVKIWFAGRWSILVTKSEYLTDMFRNEESIRKQEVRK
jgi:xanthocillin biosynthesis cytochrome P450 monooxygenase